MNAPARPRFDPTWNYGHIFIAIGMIVGWLGGAFVIYGGIVATLTELTLRVKVIERDQPEISSALRRVDANEQSVTELKEQTKAIQDTSRAMLEQITGVRVDLGAVKGKLDALKEGQP